MHSQRNRAAFTLIELLVVIAIISVLSAMLFPVFVQAKNAAKATVCISNMKQIGIAAMLYLESNDSQYFPASYYDPQPGYAPQMTWIGYDNNNVNTLAAGFYGDITKPAVNKERPGLLDPYLRDNRIVKCPSRQRGSQSALALNAFDPSHPSAFYATNPNAAGKEFGPSVYESGVTSGVLVTVGVHESMIEEPSGTLLAWEHDFAVPACNFLQGHDWMMTPPDDQNLKDHFNFLHNGATNTLWCDGHAKRLTYGNLRRPMFSSLKYIYYP